MTGAELHLFTARWLLSCAKTIWRRIKDGWPQDMAIAAPPMPYEFRTSKDPIGSYYQSWKYRLAGKAEA